jgi:hypothetical protein
MDWLARQGAKRSDAQWHREHLQRGMADKDAVLCTDMGGAPH